VSRPADLPPGPPAPARDAPSEQQFHDDFYGGEAEQIFSSPLYRQLIARHVEFLRAATPGLSAARVLSLGCGDGYRELAMAPYADRVVGIDLSPVAIARARQRAAALGVTNVLFQVGDVERIAEQVEGAIDVVWCAGVLHHLTRAQSLALLRTARAVLVPDGSFVSMDPNAGRAVNLFKPFFRRAYARYHSDDERELRPARVAEMIAAAGFDAVEVRYTDAFISPLAWLFPRLPAPLAPLLARLDRLWVRLPVVRRLSSGFAVVARRTA
jgi:SAM-dependent methyltransferase